jgi:hypothetical protein
MSGVRGSTRTIFPFGPVVDLVVPLAYQSLRATAQRARLQLAMLTASPAAGAPEVRNATATSVPGSR